LSASAAGLEAAASPEVDAPEARKPEHPSWNLEIGTPIAEGRWVLERLGGGSRYEVYLVWDDRLSRRSSCSIPSPRGSSSTGAGTPRRTRSSTGSTRTPGCRPSEFWDYQLVQNYLDPRATFGEEPWASKLKAAPDEMIQMYRREDILAVRRVTMSSRRIIRKRGVSAA